MQDWEATTESSMNDLLAQGSVRFSGLFFAPGFTRWVTGLSITPSRLQPDFPILASALLFAFLVAGGVFAAAPEEPRVKAGTAATSATAVLAPTATTASIAPIAPHETPGATSKNAKTFAVAATATSPTLHAAAPDFPFLQPPSPHPWQPLPGGVWIQDVVVGSGSTPSRGVAVYLQIRGRLADGTVFFDTYKRKKWYVYTYGDGSVMKALEEAIATMREGSKRRVVIPPELGYGEHGYTPEDPEAGTVAIPPNATLVYEITFLWLRAPEREKLNKFK